MAKYPECRSCDAFCLLPGCLALGVFVPCSKMIKPEGEPCIDYEPREAPLLVDALAKMVRLLMSPVGEATQERAEAVDEAKWLLEWYQKEVGDG